MILNKISNFHCLEIEFPDINFSNYYIKSDFETSKFHHAHLFTSEDDIELRIFYDEKSYFGEKLSVWCESIDFKKFGSFIKVKVTDNNKNQRIQKIDISKAGLCSLSNSSNYYEGNKKYVILKIDTVKFYWNPTEEKKNTAEFYLEDKGFRIVAPFHSVLTPKTWFKNDGNFNFGRMQDSTKFYKLGISKFRPEFNFVSKDDRKNRIATITKEPKIQFKYDKDINEEQAVLYGNVILILASFYHHININYTLRRIYLHGTTITIKNIEEKNFIDIEGGLDDFGITGGLNKFLELSWQNETLKNYELLEKAIKLFNQSHIVDDYSTFLIRYNIIEICDKQKQDNVKFESVLNKKQTKIKQDEALKTLLETINVNEHEDFKKRWTNVQSLLQTKPMKNQLVSFLESQNIDHKKFPIEIQELKKLRNNITHGSIDKVNVEQLKQANILLYRVNGILILNLMGIKHWSLNTKIN